MSPIVPTPPNDEGRVDPPAEGAEHSKDEVERAEVIEEIRGDPIEDRDLEPRVLLEQTNAYASGLPSPELLKRYNDILGPDFARELWATAHESILLEREIREREMRAATLGQFMGFALILATLGLSAFLVVRGYSAPGVVLGTAGIVVPVVAFVGSRFGSRRS